MAARLVYGFHAVLARLRARADSVLEVFVDASRADARAQALREQIDARGVRLIEVDGARLDGMAGTRRHQGVIARVETLALARDPEELLDSLTEPALLLLLDGVQDPHNLGACLRVADAMRAHAVIAPKDRAVGITAVVDKVASGALESTPYLVVTNLARTMDALKQRGVWMIGADSHADAALGEARLDGAVGIVLGAEGGGMRRLTREKCDEVVRIPMYGAVESLNVSVAAGICLYEARRCRAN